MGSCFIACWLVIRCFSCCISSRWISDEGPEESFIGLHHINDATANGIVKYLKSILIRLGLDLNKCRGQCYDGASVMRGSISGVATQILAVSSPLKFSVNIALVMIRHNHVIVKQGT